MIVENPYTQPHYLTSFFPIRPTLIDKDRSQNGDYYRKPTQYWFVNCQPENNVCFEPLEFVQKQVIVKEWQMDMDCNRQVKRSLIHRQYARRMIISYILDAEGGVWTA